MRIHYCLGIILVLCASASAYAQQVCELKQDVLLKANSSAADSASFHQACTMDFGEFNNTFGGKAKGEYLKISGSLDYDEGHYKKWHHEACDTQSTQQHEASASYFYQKAALKPDVDAYRACLENQGGALACYAGPSHDDGDDSYVTFFVHNGEQHAKAVAKQDSQVHNGKILQNAIREGSEIDYGRQEISVERDPTAALNLSFNVIFSSDRGTNILPCVAYAPGGSSEGCRAVNEGSSDLRSALLAYRNATQVYLAAKRHQVDAIHREYPGSNDSLHEPMFKAKEREAKNVEQDIEKRIEPMAARADEMLHDFDSFAAMCKTPNFIRVDAALANSCAAAVAGSRQSAALFAKETNATAEDIQRRTLAPTGDIKAMDASLNITAYGTTINAFNEVYGGPAGIDRSMSVVVNSVRSLTGDIAKIEAVCAQ